LVYQPAGFRQHRIHTDADGGVANSQSPVQSVAAEGTQAQGKRMDSPGAASCSDHWNFLTRSWKRDRQGSRKSKSGCRQLSTRAGNNLINLINVFQLMPLLSLSPLVPRELVYALK
jgi:hypothetical protein